MTSRSKFDHLMIDIETMSLHQTNALILSIGAVSFDPTADTFKDVIGSSSTMVPNIHMQLLMGRHVSVSTQKFWMDQPIEASKHWANEANKMQLAEVCDHLDLLLEGKKKVWANHILFDLGNIEGLYQQVRKTRASWHYRAPVDMPSFNDERMPDIGRLGDNPDANGWLLTPHEPVSDCMMQIHQVWARYPKTPFLDAK